MRFSQHARLVSKERFTRATLAAVRATTLRRADSATIVSNNSGSNRPLLTSKSNLMVAPADVHLNVH